MLAAATEMARREHCTMSELVREALREYERKNLWAEANAYGQAKSRERGLTQSDVEHQAPVATSNSSTRGRVKLLHPWQRDGGTLFGRIALGNLNR